MTDEELAEKLEEESRTFPENDFRALLENASSRIYALSAHCALLKASLAPAERKAEKPAASAATECQTCGGAGVIGGPSFYAPDEGGVPCPECSASEVGIQTSEPRAWAHFVKNGNIRIWTSAAKEAVRIAKETGIELTPLYTEPQPDRVAALTAEVERLRTDIDRIRSKVFSATICHPRGVQPLLEEALSGAAPEPMTAAARDVLAERARQISAEGWTPEYDDQHDIGELADAAACYAVNSVQPNPWRDRAPNHWPFHWPFADFWWKPTNPRRDLLKAGALILAEIERLDRAAGKEAQS